MTGSHTQDALHRRCVGASSQVSPTDAPTPPANPCSPRARGQCPPSTPARSGLPHTPGPGVIAPLCPGGAGVVEPPPHTAGCTPASSWQPPRQPKAWQTLWNGQQGRIPPPRSPPPTQPNPTPTHLSAMVWLVGSGGGLMGVMGARRLWRGLGNNERHWVASGFWLAERGAGTHGEGADKLPNMMWLGFNVSQPLIIVTGEKGANERDLLITPQIQQLQLQDDKGPSANGRVRWQSSALAPKAKREPSGAPKLAGSEASGTEVQCARHTST